MVLSSHRIKLKKKGMITLSMTLDVLVIIIVAVFAFFGYKRGIARTLVSIAGTFLSTLLTMLLSNPIAQAIYFGGFKNTIIEKVNDAMALMKTSGETTLREKILDELPDFVADSLPGFNISNAQLADAASKSSQQVEELIRPIVISFISLIVSFVLFAVFSVVVKVAAKFIADRIDDWAGGIINQMLGAAVGIVEGFVLILMISFIIKIAVPHMENVPHILSNDSIEHSQIFKGVYDSPILAAFSEED